MKFSWRRGAGSRQRPEFSHYVINDGNKLFMWHSTASRKPCTGAENSFSLNDICSLIIIFSFCVIEFSAAKASGWERKRSINPHEKFTASLRLIGFNIAFKWNFNGTLEKRWRGVFQSDPLQLVSAQNYFKLVWKECTLMTTRKRSIKKYVGKNIRFPVYLNI